MLPKQEKSLPLITIFITILIISSFLFPGVQSVYSSEELEIEIINPLKKDIWTGSSEQNISWELYTNLEPSEIEITLEYVYEGSGPYLIKTYEQGELSKLSMNYTWEVPEIDSDEVNIIIRAEGRDMKRWQMVTFSIASTPPQFLFSSPGRDGFVLSDNPIRVTFDKEIDIGYFKDNFTIFGPQGKIVGTASQSSNDNSTIEFDPFLKLEPGDDYYFELSGNIKDTSDPGNYLEINKRVDFSVKEGRPQVDVSIPIQDDIRIGNSTEINWDTDQEDLASEPIDISYSLDQGYTWITIVEGLEDTDTFEWDIPKEPFVNYPVNGVIVNVSVENAYGFTGHGHSSIFTIYKNLKPTVEIDRPYEGLVLVEGQETEIWWNATDDIDLPNNPITISISTDGGYSWRVISHDVKNDGVYTWNIDMVAESAVINISCTDANGATSWTHSDEFTILEENPIELTIEPVMEIYHPRDRITIEWGSTPIVEDLQVMNIYFSDDGESWRLEDEVEADRTSKMFSIPFAMSSRCQIKVEIVDGTGPLYSVVSERFEVIPLLQTAQLRKMGDSVMIHLSFSSWVSRGGMEQTLTLFRDGERIGLEKDDVYAMSAADIVIILDELDLGEYSLRLNSTNSSLEFSEHEIYTFEITDRVKDNYVTYWPILLLIPIPAFLLLIYKKKLGYSNRGSKRKFR